MNKNRGRYGLLYRCRGRTFGEILVYKMRRAKVWVLGMLQGLKGRFMGSKQPQNKEGVKVR